MSTPGAKTGGGGRCVSAEDVAIYRYPCDVDLGLRREIVEAFRASSGRFEAAQFERDGQGGYPLLGEGVDASVLGWLYPAMHLTLSPREGRAAADRGLARQMVLRAIRQGQFREAGHPADGVWQWEVGDGETVYPRDRNTAGFMGCALVRIWANDPLRLSDWPAGDLAVFKEAVRASIDAAIRNPVRIGYANPQILDFYLGWVAADLLGEPRYREMMREHLEAFLAYARTTDTYEEYLSPTYMAVNLSAAVPLAHYAKGGPDEGATAELLERTWAQIGAAAHGPTRQLCGPHSRAYTDISEENVEQMYGWLHLAAPDVFTRPGDDASVYPAMVDAFAAPGLYVPLGVPADVMSTFGSTFDTPVEQAELLEWIGRCTWQRPYDLSAPDGAKSAPRFRLATRYRSSRFCVGSVNEQDVWLQRRSVLAYWLDGAGEPTGLKWQVAVEVDDPDAFLSDWLFMMGVELVSVQSGGEVIGAYRSAPVVRAKRGDVLTAPSASYRIGYKKQFEPVAPVAWLLGTHWRQGIEPAFARQRVKGLWIGVTPVGAGRWQRLDDAGTRWAFVEGGIEAVVETPGGATLVRRANRTANDEPVECLQLVADEGFAWDWLDPPNVFLPFGLAVQEAGQPRRFGLEVNGDAEACELRRGALRMRWQSPVRPEQVEQRTWWGTVGEREILPRGYGG